MIQLSITGRNYELSGKIKDYAREKIGQLDKYLPRNARDIQGEVILHQDASGREDNQFVCEVIIRVPQATLQAKEATLNMYAAIDIAEAKIKSQILKYKEKHTKQRRQQARAWARKLISSE